jgi:ABC-type bacteriocin/lantibiotic exporter with double-glycine peptidase domain
MATSTLRSSLVSAVRLLDIPRRTVVLGVVCATGAAVLVFPSGLLLQRSLTSLKNGGSVRDAILFAVLSTLMQVVGSVLTFVFRVHLSGGLLVRGTAKLRVRLLRAGLAQDTLAARQEGAASVSCAIVEQVLSGLVPGLLLGLSGLAFCVWRDPLFGIVSVLCVVPLIVAAPRASRKFASASWAHRNAQRRVSSRVLALLRMREQIADHAAMESVVEQETSEIRRLSDAAGHALRSLAVHTQVQFVGMALAVGIALSVGIWRVEHGALTYEELLACLFALVPAQTGGRMISQAFAQTLALPQFVDHVNAALAGEPETATIPDLTPNRSIDTISCSSVSAGFDETVLFAGLTLSLSRGDRLFLIGPNGVGKSTLLRILAGRMQPRMGTVSVNGVTITDEDRSWIGKRIALVPQEAGAIEGSVRDNLVLFGSHATDDDLTWALRVAGLSMPLDRQVGPDGSALSGGQRQRLVLARAVLQRPDVLLLDEPTTHLDWSLSTLLYRLQEACPEAAIVVVTHDRTDLERDALTIDLARFVPHAGESGAPAVGALHF